MKNKKGHKILACLMTALLLASMLCVSAAAEDTEEENTLTNSIASTTRTVAQDGSTLSAESVDGVDTYTVSSKEGITVTYSNSMDMTILAASFLSTIQNYYSQIEDAWTALQTFYYWITDDTVIYLSYQFDSGVDLSALTDDNLTTLASQITLTSDMFTFSNQASDLKVNTETNALIITCHWNSDNAASKMNSDGSLSPTITITGITLPLVSDWGTTTAEDGTTTENDSLTVVANGKVTGTMYAEVTTEIQGSTMTLYEGTADIDGGTAADTFVLVMASEEETEDPQEETEEPQEETTQPQEETTEESTEETEELTEETEETEETQEETEEESEDTEEETTEDTGDTEETTDTGTITSPQTGDEGILLWMMIAAAALISIAVFRKCFFRG